MPGALCSGVLGGERSKDISAELSGCHNLRSYLALCYFKAVFEIDLTPNSLEQIVKGVKATDQRYTSGFTLAGCSIPCRNTMKHLK